MSSRSARPKTHDRLSVREMWRAVSPLIEPRYALITVGVLSLIAGASQAGMIVLVGQIAVGITTDETGSFGRLENLDTSVLLTLAFLLAAVMTIAGTAAIFQATKLGARALTTARMRLSDAFLHSSWALRSRERQGHLQELLSTHAKNASMAVLAVGGSLAATLNCTALVVAAFVVDPLTTLVIALAGGGLTLAFRPLHQRLRRASKQAMHRNEDYTASVAETVSLTQDLMVFGVGPAYENRLNRSAERVSHSLMRSGFLQRAVPEWFRNGIFLLILVGLAALATSEAGQVASLTVVILLLFRAVTYARDITVVFTRLQELIPYVEQMDEARRTYESEPLPETGSTLESIDRLQLDSVSYAYPGTDAAALTNLSLTIGKGETLGIVGPSGSGKSTLLQILLRLRVPDEGRFVVNGVAASDFNLHSYTQHVAFVAQDLVVFEGTVAENIRFFRPDISDEVVEIAATKAHIHGEIMAMADGYQTQLTGLGGGISGGQRQRLCIARALAGAPDVIVLDEPTSALDAQSEAAVSAALAELSGHTTLIIISHRLSTLRTCDRVAIMDKGTISAIGTSEELEESSTFYRRAISMARGD